MNFEMLDTEEIELSEALGCPTRSMQLQDTQDDVAFGRVYGFLMGDQLYCIRAHPRLFEYHNAQEIIKAELIRLANEYYR